MSIAALTWGHADNDAQSVGTQPLAARFLVAAGLVGPLFFFIVVIVEGATRPGYNAWHDVVSTLALVPGGWVLTAGLAVLGGKFPSVWDVAINQSTAAAIGVTIPPEVALQVTEWVP
jgi:hypothetical protein